MAAITNTFVSPSAVGNREELSDVVNRITPEDTPIYSLIGSGSCKTTHPEWEKEDLAAPGDNVRTEGDEYTFAAITTPDRMGNYTQIMRKDWIVSNTQNATDNAGDAEKGLKKQKLKKGIELRKDIEFSLVAANASAAGATRKSGSLSTWYETNVSRGGGTVVGANGGFDPATGLTVAPTNSTDQRAFSKTLLDNVMQSGYQNGANFKQVVVSPYVKSVFVTFMSDANVASFRYAAQGGKGNSIVATADMYEGPFGKVAVMPNRVMSTAATARNVHLIDPEMAQWLWFRKIKEDKDLAKTGDAQKKVLIGEGTLRVKNEAGLGVIADVYGLSATS